jgi:hypothetical protein
LAFDSWTPLYCQLQNEPGLDMRRSARRGRVSSQSGLLRHAGRRSCRRYRGRGVLPSDAGRIRSVRAGLTGLRAAVALAANVLAAESTEQTQSGNRKNSTHGGFLPFQSEARLAVHPIFPAFSHYPAFSSTWNDWRLHPFPPSYPYRDMSLARHDQQTLPSLPEFALCELSSLA